MCHLNIFGLKPTRPLGPSAERCVAPSPPAPLAGRRRENLPVRSSEPCLRFVAVTSGTPPGPAAPPLHTPEAEESRRGGIWFRRRNGERTSEHPAMNIRRIKRPN